MTPFNVALIGYGYAGRTFHAPLINAAADLHLAMVASSDAAKVHADWPDVEVVATPQAAMNDPSIDLVVIATPNNTHAPLAICALQAGKAVVIDKPFAVTLEEARAVMHAATACACLASVFHNRRWDADFLALKDLLDHGGLGAVVSFESHFDRFRPVVRDRWREQAGPGAGVWYDLAPHLIDQALVLFGAPEAVFADIAIRRAGAGAADDFHSVLHYPRHRVVLAASMLRADSRLRFAVHGAEGSLISEGLDIQEDQLKAGASPRSEGFGRMARPGLLTLGEAAAQPLPPATGRYADYYAAIAKALSGAGPNPVPLDQAYDVMRIIALGELSSRERRVALWGDI